MRLKSASLITSLSLLCTACASWPSWTPKPPAVTQYGVHADVNPPGFYGVHSKTKKRVYRDFSDPAMKGAQCVSADEYEAGEAWLERVRQAARQNCKR